MTWQRFWLMFAGWLTLLSGVALLFSATAALATILFAGCALCFWFAESRVKKCPSCGKPLHQHRKWCW